MPLHERKQNLRVRLLVHTYFFIVFVQFRLSDQLRSSADPTNDFGVINVADPGA
ncbi:transmembrane protein, putative [Medicago truncatula]|uniref:Transmembrane protein, putative n=1 Tax=Medicago truncatula TaxID=3880 RepID=G7L2C1_MEDTR|nr:transmembrane protein, putative [Medicago truncatula]